MLSMDVGLICDAGQMDSLIDWNYNRQFRLTLSIGG
jgi:hypothetical protein